MNEEEWVESKLKYHSGELYDCVTCYREPYSCEEAKMLKRIKERMGEWGTTKDLRDAALSG